MKRVFVITLTALLLLGMLAGCNSAQPTAALPAAAPDAQLPGKTAAPSPTAPPETTHPPIITTAPAWMTESTSAPASHSHAPSQPVETPPVDDTPQEPYSFTVGNQTIDAQWLVNHTAEEWMEAGLDSSILDDHWKRILGSCENDMQVWDIKRKMEIQYELEYPAGATCGDGARDDSIPYHRGLDFDLDVFPLFAEYAGEKRFNEWRRQFYEYYSGDDARPISDCNLYTQIVELNIPEKTVRDFCREFKEKIGRDFLPEQVIDWIFEGNKEAVYRYYLMPDAFMVGDCVFTAEWLEYYSVEKWQKFGLTVEILEENLDTVLRACVVESQRDMIRLKFDRLKNLEKTR